MKHEFPNGREILARLAPVRGGGVPDPDARRIFALVAWSVLVEPGDGVAGRLVAGLGPEEALQCVVARRLDASAADAAGVTPAEFTAGIARWSPRLDVREVATALDTAARARIRLLVPGDPEWPALVDDLGAHAPLCLWVRGNLTALAGAEPAVALVGARAATGYGEHVAMEFGAELAGRGVTVVSGAAYGIDGMAHRATLAAGGRTLALLAGGVDRPYPAGHANLLERIASSGAVVSEVPCGGAPTKWRFLMRNRLIAALGSATVVVEAGWRSGSLNTAGHAATLGRPLGAVPGPVTSAASAGCHRLLREFDARCVTSVDDVMELLGATLSGRLDAREAGGPTSDDTRVLDALSVRAWRETADVARRSGLGIAEVEGILGVLSLDGTALRDERGWRRTATTM
ncbi:MAG TPA: DNA-processing protein DprA [Microbacterium sp.]|uniref:DNA-processing protein DprA n=1 Tax=Microbacterium sp. TaxID=51671 RepID=UPI002CD646CC|nr:DNA-processing protein DprA [Microbacterium sp.]HWI30523.1 DNA-processing protein DprA [Microbacterium sp.]